MFTCDVMDNPKPHPISTNALPVASLGEWRAVHYAANHIAAHSVSELCAESDKKHSKYFYRVTLC